MMIPFNTVSGENLKRVPAEAPRFVAASLLPEGLHVLWGAPKTGKSWLALWLSLCVSRGDPFWCFECRRGSVLYLCLDDPYQRIWERLLSLPKEAPASLYFANSAGTLEDGLPARLNGFLDEHPDTRLIVIDTPAGIRGDRCRGDGYEDLAVLRELALRRHVAVLCVDHPQNPHMTFEDMLSGNVDSVFFLEREKRFGSCAWLRCAGKDIEPRDLRLEWQGPMWTLCRGQKYVPLNGR